jgi:putative CocE/NonD family hydrolase
MDDDGHPLDLTTEPLHPGVPNALERQLQGLGATGDRYQVEYLLLPMRDGVRLATIVIRPRAAGRVPTVMERTPYTRHLPYDVYRRVFRAGWAVVIQNERGTGWSEGEFGLLYRVADDCADTMTWIAEQPWSNGSVGLLGCSSPAENQLRISALGHPALKAGVPMSAGAGVGNIPGCEGTHGLFYKGGIPVLSTWTAWYHPSAIIRRPRLPLSDDPDENARAMRTFELSAPGRQEADYRKALERERRIPPSADVLKRMGVPRTRYDAYMLAEPLDPIWDSVDLIHAHHTGATPALNINGWLDVGAYETIKLFEFQQHHPDQYLIMAASAHCAMLRSASPQAYLGDRPVGNTTFPYDDVIMNWFRRWLAGEADAWQPMPKVQVFLMGGNQWLTGDRWPLPDTVPAAFYLSSGGHAQTLWGDGVLSETPPDADNPPDLLLADPHNPVPNLGFELGSDPICTDQRPVEARQDVLVYSTPPLAEGIAMVGDVDVVLHVSADVPDTDVFVKLVDVYPDNTAFNVAWSALRLRYRDGFGHAKLLLPGTVYPIRITGMTTANYFGPGHRIRLEVAGSSFPLADRNWHTGGANTRETDGPVAHCQVYHDAARPARLEYRRYVGPLALNSAPQRG